MSATLRERTYMLPGGTVADWTITNQQAHGMVRIASASLDTWAIWPLSQLIAAEHPPLAAAGEVAGSVRTLEANRTLPGKNVPGVADTSDGSGGTRGHPPAPGTPNARNTDPATAHEAANSVSEAQRRAVHLAVLEAIHEHGPLTDHDLAVKVSVKVGHMVIATSAGKRRGELRDDGMVADSGFKGRTPSGARAIRWGLTPAGEAFLIAAA